MLGYFERGRTVVAPAMTSCKEDILRGGMARICMQAICAICMQLAPLRLRRSCLDTYEPEVTCEPALGSKFLLVCMHPDTLLCSGLHFVQEVFVDPFGSRTTSAVPEGVCLCVWGARGPFWAPSHPFAVVCVCA